MNQRTEIHDRVLNAVNKEELMAAYSEWADQYDSDLLDEFGYVAPMIASSLLEKYLDNKEARILDAGCGTGIVGELLHQSGYLNIDGMDYSPHMLEKAKEKSIYKRLTQSDLMESLDITDNSYDAVISVGAFTCGHVGPGAMPELIRITKPGGIICFTVREQAWEEDGYELKMQAMEKNSYWESLENFTAGYIEKEGAQCKMCLYRVAD